MKVLKAIHVEATVFEEFKALANQEGRLIGKMLEILVQAYKIQQEVKLNEEMFKV